MGMRGIGNTENHSRQSLEHHVNNNNNNNNLYSNDELTDLNSQTDGLPNDNGDRATSREDCRRRKEGQTGGEIAVR